MADDAVAAQPKVCNVLQEKSGDCAKGIRQSRTKAKARYLKRKKDRRKHRKSEVSTTAKNELETRSDETDGEDEVEGKEQDEPETEAITKEDAPRKKRKVDEDGVREDKDEEMSDARPRSPTPEVALQRFPLPVAPNAPSKSALALQGLDKALLSAEIIDPTQILTFDALERPQGQVPVFSDKMKKRLQELGITELFAGACIFVLHCCTSNC